MNQAPKRIWLQWHGDGEPDGTPVSVPDVTWSAEKVFHHDAQYILTSEILPLLEKVSCNIACPYDVWQWLKENGFS